jgi:aldose 1-epimerase
MDAVTGIQYELTAETPAGPARAVVTEVAAGLRLYTVNGQDVAEPYAEGVQRPKGCGAVLVPWPNRVRDGRWEYQGETLQLALTEPAKGNAIHGLLRYAPYRQTDRTDSSITLSATVFPQLGFPFHLDTSVTYALGAEGLQVTHELRNVGDTDAPVAIGAHPYLRVGDVPSGDLTLTVAADTHIDVDDRSNPVGETPVEGTGYDLRSGRRVGELDLDDGFADVTMHGGRVEHSLAADDGRRVTLWGDEHMRFVQVFTPRSFPGIDGGTRQAVAIEPMTAPADALNSGEGIRWLGPGATWTVRWGIRADGF